eukprot:2261920-Prymnesium_polylepis.1
MERAVRRQQTPLPPCWRLLSDCRASSDIAKRASRIETLPSHGLRVYLSCGSGPLGAALRKPAVSHGTHTPYGLISPPLYRIDSPCGGGAAAALALPVRGGRGAMGVPCGRLALPLGLVASCGIRK